MTPKQQAYVQARIEGLGPSDAYRRAYDVGSMSPAVIAVKAQEVERNGSVAVILAEANQKAITRLEVTAERVLREYARIAFADMRRFGTVTANGGVNLVPSDQWSDDDAAAVAELGETVTEKGGSVRFKLHSKPQALDALARHLGMFANSDGEPDRHLHVHVMGQLSVDDLRRLASGDAQS